MKKLHKAKSKINGVGLFSEQSYTEGDFIAYIDGPVQVIREHTPTLSKQTLNWIGVSKYSWINTDKSVFRYINHSCEPNVAQITKRKVVAIKDIPAGEELTMDYSLTEAEEDWEIADCKCDSNLCRGKVVSIMKLPRKVFERKEQYIPEKFKSVYRSYSRQQ